MVQSAVTLIIRTTVMMGTEVEEMDPAQETIIKIATTLTKENVVLTQLVPTATMTII
jgi:hypothetical protein